MDAWLIMREIEEYCEEVQKKALEDHFKIPWFSLRNQIWHA